MRLSATLVDGGQGRRTKLHVDIDGIPRQYERWSGRPMWEVAPHGYEWTHPNGWERNFVKRGSREGHWRWLKPHDRVGRGTRDTRNCLQ